MNILSIKRFLALVLSLSALSHNGLARLPLFASLSQSLTGFESEVSAQEASPLMLAISSRNIDLVCMMLVSEFLSKYGPDAQDGALDRGMLGGLPAPREQDLFGAAKSLVADDFLTACGKCTMINEMRHVLLGGSYGLGDYFRYVDEILEHQKSYEKLFGHNRELEKQVFIAALRYQKIYIVNGMLGRSPENNLGYAKEFLRQMFLAEYFVHSDCVAGPDLGASYVKRIIASTLGLMQENDPGYAMFRRLNQATTPQEVYNLLNGQAWK